MNETQSERIELDLLLEAIYLKYGYDFRRYARASIKRRVLRFLQLSQFKTISEMQHRVLYDEQFFGKLLLELSINVTEMFRDPTFYKAIREKVIPELKVRSFVKVWNAGCATGEEAYSISILLKEEGLLKNTQIYATDFNEEAIKKAKEGIYPLDDMNRYESNYKSAGGLASLKDYYTTKYEYALMESSLKQNVVFADHNLVTDGIFGEIHLILCRNVLIYFSRELQDRVIGLFRDSLADRGFLCLGSKESIRFSSCSDDFEEVAKTERIYRKKF